MRNMKLSGLDLLESLYAERETRYQKPEWNFLEDLHEGGRT